MSGPRRFHLQTLGCPKNQVDSDKLVGSLVADGLVPTDDPAAADLVVVNTCAFVHEARQESIDVILALDDVRAAGSELVVTGCMAERYGDELSESLPEVDRVAGFGEPLTDGPARPAIGAVGARHPVPPPEAVPVTLGRTRRVPRLDLLALPRPPATRPWAYLKIAEGCDRRCGFCAIPSFRGPQRSRSIDELVDEVDQLAAQEVVLVAQDLASYGRDLGRPGDIVPLIEAVAARVDRVRMLYLYPSDLDDRLVEAIVATGVPYFDLSLQHVSRPLLRAMRRWGDGDRFLRRIDAVRVLRPDAAFRSNFIVGYPGETEDDHAELVEFVQAAQLDWCGFFAYSEEDGTHAAGLDGRVDAAVVRERLAELTELQDAVTARRRDDLVGSVVEVLVDEPGSGRTFREAPEIDGVVVVPDDILPGTFVDVRVTGATGPDLECVPVMAPAGAS